ncbi:MAG: hypothetical protein LBD32_00250 [Cytophagales bacterium]|jgi:hypothetical protein|nr:hypothetical protein [Cytophagales bacterium]
MKPGRKAASNFDGYMSNFSYDFEGYNDDTFEAQSDNVDIESIVNKLDLRIPLDEIALEENISMKSLYNCIDYLKDQRVDIDTSFYNENLNFYSCSPSLEKSFDEF